MYIKLYYSVMEQNKELESIRAVDYQDNSVSLDLNKYVGYKVTDTLKKEISNILKEYFVTNWVRE